ncbi:hybrid sensor histidine kinase/response regulator [Vibrio sp. 10N.286.49.C2]|uniref:hybrid sensor histidine kinase/response regulator n=1 Tax=unclassified Vibrio TaxID=2614977 RepID=UPI000C84947D|nr:MULTISPECIES: hybrid sensor histidine kinase/response regulator [unclassified Vibrio]PMH25440.1 hybrid sensor histidine kinase/response regulator [Vibrio sp. 10N.286.49.C2]PMH51296.1 hybrid sensor histidine kinase/response regulator [Vibrio sp. 10N.286.49.B1]PMH81584.1 hybrid sensor histidine kinase/response regulator [Vibrio sp. 10N.286.48.B7]
MNRLQKIYNYAEPNLFLVVLMGGLGFPLYYWVWEYLFPQAYENLWLRLACSASVMVLACRHYLPRSLKQYLPHYYLFSIGLCLPFFFFYMMLMNNWSDVWVLSFMSSIFIHILLVHDTRVMCIQAIISLLLASAVAHFVSDGTVEFAHKLSFIPIFGFTYVFGNLFYFRNQTEHEAKVSIAKSFGAGIAHEMRNPLSALLSSFEVMRSVVPNSNSSYRHSYHLNAQEIQTLNDIIDESMKVIWAGNETIDLLLTSIDKNRVSTSTFCKHRARFVIENAVKSYAYKNESERRAVNLELDEDFEYLGSDTLLKYVVYNLLKNAFRHRGAERFTISIRSKKTGDGYSLLVKDTGLGIEPDLIKNIFEDFYTTGKNGTFGLGLSFCKKVMMSFGGQIKCRSVEGKWTEFELKFPYYASNTINHIKLDLMKSKSLLYIGQDSSMIKEKLNTIGASTDLSVKTVSMAEASTYEEHQFEYNLIIIDGRLDRDGWALMSRLEGKLSFTEARIAFLHDPLDVRNLYFQRYVTIELFEWQKFFDNPSASLDYLMFDAFREVDEVPSYNEISSQRTVMIVDDNHSLRSITTIMLEKQGLHVLQAENGQVALDKLATESVDLILMDIEMPVLDGLSATKIIRESNTAYASVPIVGYTGDKSEETIVKINEYGMNDYVVKPTPKDELIDKVAAWI